MKLKSVKKNISKKENKQQAISPYANIDWEKASLIFQKAIDTPKSSSKYPQVREVLRILAGVGSIGLMFVFPGAASAIGSLVLGENSYSSWRAKKIFDQLEKQDYIETKYKEDGKVTVKITQKGKVRALTYQLDNMRLVRPTRWDKKWRVVIFDIPDKYKRTRDIFRSRLVQLGLYQLQESVYVSPYKCFDEVEFLRQLYGVAFTARYLLVDKIEDDELIQRHFDLI